MKFFILTSFISFSLLFSSCTSNKKEDTPIVLQNDANAFDSVLTMSKSDTIKKQYEIKETQENLKKIEKKFGEQWGFCECVVANDSIDKAVKNINDFETPAAEKLLNRFDYVAKKCQAFLGMDANRTPEERSKHERKVKKCLKEAKKKIN